MAESVTDPVGTALELLQECADAARPWTVNPRFTVLPRELFDALMVARELLALDYSFSRVGGDR